METRPATEKAARSHMSMETHRSWRVFNPETTTELGHPTAYTLMSGHNSHPYLSPESGVRKRAGFIDHHVWVTRYKPEEMNGGGYYPNQSERADGLPVWTEDDEPITGEDCKKLGPERASNRKLVQCLQPDRRVEIEVLGSREMAATPGTPAAGGTAGSGSSAPR